MFKDAFPHLYVLMPDVKSFFRLSLHPRLPETAAKVILAVHFYGIADERREISFLIFLALNIPREHCQTEEFLGGLQNEGEGLSAFPWGCV